MHAVAARSSPWHLWVVAVLTLLWNGAGAATIVMAQTGQALDMDPSEIAYYAAQPRWLVLTTDLATMLPIAAAVALLLRRRAAVWLFALSLALIVLNNLYEVAAGTSLTLRDEGWRTLIILVVAIALAQFGYAWTMKTRDLLT